ncbi:MAG: HAMP domain-containing histidine kinase [Acidimicrobiia bacterium]|nr:HAMP domain-containing histidine kinase [Acidimicrobiia bacterium]
MAIATLLVGGITGAILIGNSVEADRSDEFLRQADVTGQLIEAQLGEDAFGPPNRGNLVALLEASRLIGGHDYVEAGFRAPNGLVFVGDSSPLIEALPEEITKSRATYEVEVDGESVLALVRTFDQSRRGSSLVVAIGTTQALVPWGDFAQRLLLGLGVGLVLAALLATWLARSTGRRLDGLAVAAGAIAGGDLAARAPLSGSDEITEVAGAFNDMAGQLESGRQRESDFLMSIGHDLRTPLTTIRGYAEALADGELDTVDLPRVAASLEIQSSRLARLVEDIMLLSRLEAREFSLRPEPVDLAAHLKEAAGVYSSQADEDRVRLELDIDPVGTVQVDPDRIGQILNNLIENALRYTPQGGTVGVHLQRHDDTISLSVSDTGPGIDPEDLPRVFDRLYVAQRYRPIRPEGSGLGLNIVKELVDSMGAQVGVTSELGKGTTVFVELAGD